MGPLVTRPASSLPEAVVSAVLAGDRRALASAATLVENRRSEPLLRQLYRHSGRAELILGITGSPGSGKSTLTSQLIRHFRSLSSDSEGGPSPKSVGVIAVDPSSPYSGGAILGDRVRMLSHHADDGVFIRSMATRGHLGGLAPATADMTTLFDAAGFDVILIETVGVGQDEVEIAKLADVTLVVLTPGAGDDIQTLKAGLMEIADVFVLNKADLPGAERLEQEIRAAVALGHRQHEGGGWIPPIIATVAVESKGIAEVVSAARRFRAQASQVSRQTEIWTARLREMLRERLMQQFPDRMFEEAARSVVQHERDPYAWIDEWLSGAAAISSRKG